MTVLQPFCTSLCLLTVKKLGMILLVLLGASCTELRIDPDCWPKNEIIHEAENWKGTVIYNDELAAWMVNHYKPGTIDTYYTGAVCNLSKEYQVEDLKIIFSGYFKDDKGKIQPSMMMGGQEFYFLELISIQVDE